MSCVLYYNTYSCWVAYISDAEIDEQSSLKIKAVSYDLGSLVMVVGSTHIIYTILQHIILLFVYLYHLCNFSTHIKNNDEYDVDWIDNSCGVSYAGYTGSSLLVCTVG